MLPSDKICGVNANEIHVNKIIMNFNLRRSIKIDIDRAHKKRLSKMEAELKY